MSTLSKNRVRINAAEINEQEPKSPSSDILEQALYFARRGIAVFPCKQADKSPRVTKGFKAATTDETQIREWWSTWPNAMIGVPTGTASGIDVLDIDLKPEEYIDGFRSVPGWKKLSPVIVATPSEGRHLWFKSDGKVRSTADQIGPGVDTRGTGGYVIVPPSHNNAGDYSFTKDGLDDIDQLPPFPSELFDKLDPKHDGAGGTDPEADPQCVAAAMAVIPNDDLGWDDWKKFGMAIWRATSGSDEGFEIFDAWSQKSQKWVESTTAKEWDKIAKSPPTRIGAGTIFYKADAADPEWRLAIKGDQPELHDGSPLKSAKEFVRHVFTRDGKPCLIHHRGAFYTWTGNCYEEFDAAHLRSKLYEFLDHAVTRRGEPFNPTPSKVNSIIDALRAGVGEDAKRNPPFWITPTGMEPNADNLIACRNGLLDIETRELLPHTPKFFNVNRLPFDYDPYAPNFPETWKGFLGQLYPGDDGKQSRLTLAEMFGLMLTPDTRQQKIFMIVGPKRSGKGTIARVLTALLGKDSIANPTLSSLSSNFGLSPLIDKRCAIISDARLGAQGNVAERLLTISGEDAMTIDRKYREPWTGRLLVRFLVLTNELPNISDSSGALASRFVLLTMSNSFYGSEDIDLTDKLLQDLPGILNWALYGLERLRKRGHFKMPQSSLEAIRQLEDLG